MRRLTLEHLEDRNLLTACVCEAGTGELVDVALPPAEVGLPCVAEPEAPSSVIQIEADATIVTITVPPEMVTEVIVHPDGLVNVSVSPPPAVDPDPIVADLEAQVAAYEEYVGVLNEAIVEQNLIIVTLEAELQELRDAALEEWVTELTAEPIDLLTRTAALLEGRKQS